MHTLNENIKINIIMDENRYIHFCSINQGKNSDTLHISSFNRHYTLIKIKLVFIYKGIKS